MPKQIFAKEYEEYLITGKEEVLNSLPSGSIEKEYFILIRKLLNEELTADLQKQIDSFLERIPESQSYRLKALNIFKKLKKNPKEKNEIIQDIKSLFNLGNVKSHSKPVKYNKTSNDVNQKDDSQRLPNSLNINNYIKINKFIEDIYSNNIIPSDENYKKIFGNEYVNLKFDFNKIPEKILVKMFTNNKEYRRTFNYAAQSITYAKLDYFKKVIKLIVEECSKNEEIKTTFRNFICDKIYFLLDEQINAI